MQEDDDLLDVRLSSGGRILFGRTNLRWRLDRLSQIIQDAARRGEVVESADLTLDSNFPVKFARR